MENISHESAPQIPQPPVPVAGLPKVSTLFKLAFDYYKEHFNVIASVMVVPFALQAASILFGNSPIAAFCSLVAVLASLLATIVLVGLIVGGWNKDEGIALLYQKSFKWIGPLIAVNAYVMLTTIGGVFMLIVPGIYVTICLGFSIYFLFAENKRGKFALVASWYYVKGHWSGVFWRMFALWFVLAVIGLLFAGVSVGPYLSRFLEMMKNQSIAAPAPKMSSMVSLFSAVIQLFVIVPISLVYSAFIFKALHALKPAMSDEETQKTEKTVRAFMTVGLAGLLLVIAVSGYFILYSLGKFSGTPGALMDAFRGILGK